MSYKAPPRNLVGTLAENLRTFYSSIQMDRKNKLESLLAEFSDVEEDNERRFEVEYSEIPSDSEYKLYSVDIEKNPHSENFEPIKGHFFLLKNTENNLIYTFTNQNKEFLNKVIIKFLHTEFPDIFRFNYSSSELRQSLNYFEEYIESDLHATRTSSKRLFGEEAETRVQYKGDKPPHYSEVFEQAREENLWVDWLRTKTDSDPYYDISMSREGSFRFISGDIQGTIRILTYLGELSLEKHDMLSERQIEPQKDPMPLVLKYDFDVFDKKEHRERLISEFSNFKRCSYSVIHDGNPHIYMYVSDNQDDSSYSVRSIGNSKIVITPQTSSSPASLLRLIDFFSSNFMDPHKIEEVT